VWLGERLMLEVNALAMFNEQLVSISMAWHWHWQLQLEGLSYEMRNGRLSCLPTMLRVVTDCQHKNAVHISP
jgi:hypothetical protein